MAELAIAIVAGFNWLNHCAGLVEVNRERFSGTLSSFRKIVALAQQWWAMEGADARYSQMLAEQQVPPLMLYLVWLEYTRLAKEIASSASFGPSIDRAIEKRREALAKEFADRPSELGAALDELRETMAAFVNAREPPDLDGWCGGTLRRQCAPAALAPPPAFGERARRPVAATL